MLKKIIGLVFLFCFAFSLDGEARQRSAPRRVATAQKNIKRPTTRKKRDATVIRKKRPHRVATGRKRTQRVSRTRNRPQRVSRVRTRSQRASRVRARPQLKRRRSCQPVSIQLPPPTYLSKLKLHTQRNAQLAGFDRLYAKGYYGRGTAAVIEYSGDWDEIHSIKQGGGSLSPESRENYRRNFLPPIGDPQGRLHPDATNEWLRLDPSIPYHGSKVASVILDLSPDAQVQPVSVFYCPHSYQQYTVADALLNLSQRGDSVINISSAHMDFLLKNKARQNPTDPQEYKMIYPRFVAACKAVAAAGKVIILTARNDQENIQPPEYRPSGSDHVPRYIGYLLKKLKNDHLTRQSIIIAGALNHDTNTIAAYSNRPGSWTEAQERFLCASGEYELSYQTGNIIQGTCLAAPTICSAILDLCSIPGVTPQRAAKALLETAEKGLDPALYGRGRMHAARAAEWLEAGNY